MYEMYCGKDCQSCSYREATACRGCLSQREHCEIARCCRSKGHENCETCSFQNGCGKLQSKEHVPVYRQRELERLAEKEAAAARRAPIMAKWLSVIFWLLVISNVIDLFGQIPGLAPVGAIGTTVCALGYVWALLRMRGEDPRYQTAGICALVQLVVSLAIELISGGGAVPNWTLVLSLPAAIVALVGEYNKCQAHSSVVGGVDAALGEKWEKIWTWQIISKGTMMGSAVLMVILPVLGALIVIAAGIAALVVAIMEIVTLYKSAQAFRQKIS